MQTTTVTPIRITGNEARDIAHHVTIYVKPTASWSEVQVLRECAHGCKLYVKAFGGHYVYALIHSASYGCPLGRSAETREVPVLVEPLAPTPEPSVYEDPAVLAAIFSPRVYF